VEKPSHLSDDTRREESPTKEDSSEIPQKNKQKSLVLWEMLNSFLSRSGRGWGGPEEVSAMPLRQKHEHAPLDLGGTLLSPLSADEGIPADFTLNSAHVARSLGVKISVQQLGQQQNILEK